VFFNGESYNIRWEVEGVHHESAKTLLNLIDRERENEDEEKEEGGSCEDLVISKKIGEDKNIEAFTQKGGGGGEVPQ
jgi:hypothetical protein